jgi:hypothetical protein
MLDSTYPPAGTPRTPGLPPRHRRATASSTKQRSEPSSALTESRLGTARPMKKAVRRSARTEAEPRCQRLLLGSKQPLEPI